MRGFSLALVLVAGTSCGGDAKHIEMTPVPARESVGAFDGALCQGAACTCRSGSGDGGAGLPTGDGKRFELRLGSPYELWASLGGRRMYKDKERAEKCFYVDLPPGEHQVELRASNANGVAATLAIQELGTATKAWYDTFKFTCGNPGACSFEELEGRKAEMAAAASKNVYDKCGSVKVKNVVWDTGRSPDQQFPSELIVRMTLQVYKFAPEYPPGDPNCGKPRARGDAPATDEGATPAPATP